MKIKKIDIRNIASIAEAEIDFDGAVLSAEPLFLICGDTGSGKTTILDAISLALYNNTPRLNQAGREKYTDVNGCDITLSSPVQYLRKGTGKGYIHLFFESGGKTYTAKWSIARAYNKADGKFQKIDWTVENNITHIEEKGQEIEKIIGMGFEEFRRTVMLAQGEFTAFLKSKSDEKTKILEKITGTGIYKEIGKKIGEHYRKALSDFEVKSKGIEVLRNAMLDDDTVMALKTETEASVAEAALRQKIRSELEILKVAKENEEEASAEVERNLKALNDAESEFSRLSGGLAYAEKVLQEKTAELESIKLYIGQRAEKDDIYKTARLIIKDLKDVEANEKSISEKKNQAKDYRNKCEDINSKLKDIKKDIALKEKEFAMCKDSLGNLTAEKERLCGDKLKSLKSILEGLDSLKVLSTNISEEIAAGEKELEGLNKELTDAQARYQSALQVYNSASAIYEKMKDANSQWAKDARAGLKAGDACPVCGQVIPSQDYLDSISQAHFQSLLTPVKEELAKAESDKDNCHKTLTKITAEINAIDKVLAKRRNELSKNNLETAKLVSQRNAMDYPDLELAEVDKRLERVDQITEMIEKQNATLAYVSYSVGLLKVKQGRINAEKAACIANIDSLEKNIEETCIKNTEIIERTDSKMGNGIWRSEWELDRDDFLTGLEESADAYLAAVEKEKQMSITLRNIKETLETMSSIKDSIIRECPAFGKLPIGECIMVKGQLELWSNLKSAIISSVNGLTTAKEKHKKHYEDAQKALECLAADSDAFRIEICEINQNKVKHMLEALTKEISALNEKIGSNRSLLSQNEKYKNQIAKDMAELKEITLTRDKWKELNDVFGKKDGEYFQKIAQSFVMNDILSRANYYLKTITKRYILESQPDSLEILVRDMEQGGVTRSTSTISGGESFIISLALALGLSSLGSGGNIYVDTLFIDEGFGTLSGEYLDTVMETLQKLNETGGKRVGIISHVKELRERIGAKIIVTKVNPTESKVTVTV